MTFTSKDIEEKIGLKINTLHIYCQAKAIIPDVSKSNGSGTIRLFSSTNFMEAMIIYCMMRDGMPRRVIVEILKGIRSRNNRHLLKPEYIIERNSETYLIIENKNGGFDHQFFISRDQRVSVFGFLGGDVGLIHFFDLKNMALNIQHQLFQHTTRR